jgi:hypothetical protein
MAGETRTIFESGEYMASICVFGVKLGSYARIAGYPGVVKLSRYVLIGTLKAPETFTDFNVFEATAQQKPSGKLRVNVGGLIFRAVFS